MANSLFVNRRVKRRDCLYSIPIGRNKFCNRVAKWIFLVNAKQFFFKFFFDLHMLHSRLLNHLIHIRMALTIQNKMA